MATAERRRRPPIPEYRWWALRDGIGHAYPTRSRRVPALCGQRPMAENWTWPVQERCGPCVELSQAAIRDAIAGTASR